MKMRFQAAILAKRIGSREPPAAEGAKRVRSRRISLRRISFAAGGVALAAMIAVPVLALGSTSRASAQSNAVAQLPPLGFNDWGYAQCTEVAGVLEAEAAAIHGSPVPGSAPAPGSLQTLGYDYVNNDGCWNDLVGEGTTDPGGGTITAKKSATYPGNGNLPAEVCSVQNGRLPNGQIFVNPYEFPPSSTLPAGQTYPGTSITSPGYWLPDQPNACLNDGIEVVANYVHSLGLKFGLWEDDSNNWNCEEIPGAYGYDTIDAETYASWGVDYVKGDWGCSATTVAPLTNTVGATPTGAGNPLASTQFTSAAVPLGTTAHSASSPYLLPVTALTAAIPDGTVFEISTDPNTPNVVFTTTAVAQVGATSLPVTLSFPSGSTDVTLTAASGTGSPATLTVSSLTQAWPTGTQFTITGDPNSTPITFTTTAAAAVGATSLSVSESASIGTTIPAGGTITLTSVTGVPTAIPAGTIVPFSQFGYQAPSFGVSNLLIPNPPSAPSLSPAVAQTMYTAMSNALQATGRQIAFAADGAGITPAADPWLLTSAGESAVNQIRPVSNGASFGTLAKIINTADGSVDYPTATVSTSAASGTGSPTTLSVNPLTQPVPPGLTFQIEGDPNSTPITFMTTAAAAVGATTLYVSENASIGISIPPNPIVFPAGLASVGLPYGDSAATLDHPGFWIDPDYLEASDGMGLPADESEMSLASELAMPLLMSTDLQSTTGTSNFTVGTACTSFDTPASYSGPTLPSIPFYTPPAVGTPTNEDNSTIEAGNPTYTAPAVNAPSGDVVPNNGTFAQPPGTNTTAQSGSGVPCGSPSAYNQAIFGNSSVVAVDQDSLAKAGSLISLSPQAMIFAPTLGAVSSPGITTTATGTGSPTTLSVAGSSSTGLSSAIASGTSFEIAGDPNSPSVVFTTTAAAAKGATTLSVSESTPITTSIPAGGAIDKVLALITAATGTGTPTTLTVSATSVAMPASTTFEISNDPNSPNIVFTTTAPVAAGATSIPVSESTPITTTIPAGGAIDPLLDLVLAKPLANGSVAVTLFNESTQGSATISTNTSAIGLGSGPNTIYSLDNLWTNAVTNTPPGGAISATVAPEGVVMYVVTPPAATVTTVTTTTTLPAPVIVPKLKMKMVPNESDLTHPHGSITLGNHFRLRIHLYGSDGTVSGKVSVHFSGQTLCRRTLLKGVAKCGLHSTTLGHGKHTLVVSYQGQGWYYSLSEAVTIRVS